VENRNKKLNASSYGTEEGLENGKKKEGSSKVKRVKKGGKCGTLFKTGMEGIEP